MHAYYATSADYMDINDVVLFYGTNDTLTFARGGGDFIVTAGTDQTVSIGICSPDTLVDLGQGLNLETTFSMAALTVYDFQFDKTAHVTLFAGQSDTTASDGHGGTLMTINSFVGAPAKVDFVDDRHVAVVHT